MDWLWLVPLFVALLLVPAMFGVWAWAEVIERVREEYAAIGRRTRTLRVALVMASAAYLVGAATWIHPAVMEHILAAGLSERLTLYVLIVVPWGAFGVIGLIARAGRRTGVRGFLEDRLRQERRVGVAQERSRAFLHSIGTELEDVLRDIQGKGQRVTAHDPSSTDPPPVGPAALHEEAVQRLESLAQALRMPVAREPSVARLDDILKEALSEVQHLAQERRVAVFRSGPEGLHVETEPRHMRQVFHVLFEGALMRAPRDDGVVIIAVRPGEGGGLLEVVVRDNGRTMEAADLARAFTLDTEVPDGHGGSIPGFGFPLAVARTLARQGGGDLWLSAAVEGGTVAALLLRSPPEEEAGRRASIGR